MQNTEFPTNAASLTFSVKLSFAFRKLSRLKKRVDIEELLGELTS